jgi:hypothetical protein
MEKQFITEAERLQKLAGISEIKIIPSSISNSEFLSSPNTRHPDLYNFIKQRSAELLTAVREDMNKESYNSFEEATNIVDINDVVIDSYNWWEDIDEEEEYPNGQEIIISRPGSDECTGLIISNLDNKSHDNLTSGMSFEPIPGFPGLYYDYIWC